MLRRRALRDVVGARSATPIGEARVVGTFVEGAAVYETADLGG
jgi:hypothetical protein